jgi:hypothetical protein
MMLFEFFFKQLMFEFVCIYLVALVWHANKVYGNNWKKKFTFVTLPVTRAFYVFSILIFLYLSRSRYNGRVFLSVSAT